MFVRTPFNYDGDVVSHRSGVDCSEAPTRAQQHFRDECDINVLVQRFSRTGVPSGPPVPPPVVYDQVFDFQSAMQAVIDGKAAFAALPASVRDRFQNDPARFLSFVHDDGNFDEAVRLGIVPAPPADPPPAPLASDGSVPSADS